MFRVCVIIAVISLSFLTPPAWAEQASRESILKLLDASGSRNLGVEIANDVIPELKSLLPDAPQGFWTEVKAEIMADNLVEEIIPIYQKYLTAEDIVAINEFNSTPAGKKLLKAQPLITEETYRISEQWGQHIVEQVLRKYQREVKGGQ